MKFRPGAFRKAIEDQRDVGGYEPKVRDLSKKERALASESKDRYRAFVDSVNRSSDKEIERALKHA